MKAIFGRSLTSAFRLSASQLTLKIPLLELQFTLCLDPGAAPFPAEKPKVTETTIHRLTNYTKKKDCLKENVKRWRPWTTIPTMAK